MATSTRNPIFARLQQAFNKQGTPREVRKNSLQFLVQNPPNAESVVQTIETLGAYSEELYLSGDQIHLDGLEIVVN